MNLKSAKYYIYTVLAIVAIGCNSGRSAEVIAFEEELGEENIEMIDQLVHEFDNHLLRQYPALENSKAYTQFLKDISDSVIENDSILIAFRSAKLTQEFKSSSLFNEMFIKEPYYYIPKEGEIELSLVTPPTPAGKDEKIVSEPDSIYRVNTIGKYMRALYTIKEKDSVVEKYFQVRDGWGVYANQRFANGVLYNKPNFKDYIHKRIVVLEFSY